MTAKEKIEQRARELLAEWNRGHPNSSHLNYLSYHSKQKWRRLARLTFQWERDAQQALVDGLMNQADWTDSTADREVRTIKLRESIDREYAELLPGAEHDSGT